jgi:ABC-type hemin transport system substrate-binding protein
MAFPARRVVSLVPSLTETVCDLGVSGRLVAVTRFCHTPEEPLRFIPRIGGTKNPDRETLASFAPDLVLVNGEENRREDIEWLSSRFEVHESLPQSVPDAAAVVKEIGRLLGVEDAAEAIALEIEAEMARIEVDGLELPHVRVFYPIWKQPWIAVNRSTYVHDVLARAGAVNVCAERESRYPVVAQADLPALRPDIVLLPSEPFAFSREHRRLLAEERAFGRDIPHRDGRRQELLLARFAQRSRTLGGGRARAAVPPRGLSAPASDRRSEQRRHQARCPGEEPRDHRLPREVVGGVLRGAAEVVLERTRQRRREPAIDHERIELVVEAGRSGCPCSRSRPCREPVVDDERLGVQEAARHTR